MGTEEKINRLIRAELDGVARADFAALRTIPSTYTWKVIDYVSGLDATGRDALFDTFASRAMFLFFPDRDPGLDPGRSGNATHREFTKAMTLLFDWKYQDARALRAIAADSRSSRPLGIAHGVPTGVLRRAEAIVPLRAAEIRKLVRAKFVEQFAASRIENQGGGAWSYSGSCNRREFRLAIDYGGRSDQLRYEVFYEHPPSGIRATRLTYEGMLGLGFGRWDFVTAENVADAVTTLCGLVEQLVSLPERWGL